MVFKFIPINTYWIRAMLIVYVRLWPLSHYNRDEYLWPTLLTP